MMSPAQDDGVAPMFRFTIGPDWIDGNDHVNAAFYLLIVKDAAMAAHDAWDYGVDFRRRTGESNFVMESHVRYFRELKLGADVAVKTRLVDFDDKRVHLSFEIYNEREGYLAAIVEYVTLHVRLASPAARPLPPDLRERLARVRARDAQEAPPREANGRWRLSLDLRRDR